MTGKVGKGKGNRRRGGLFFFPSLRTPPLLFRYHEKGGVYGTTATTTTAFSVLGSPFCWTRYVGRSVSSCSAERFVLGAVSREPNLRQYLTQTR